MYNLGNCEKIYSYVPMVVQPDWYGIDLTFAQNHQCVLYNIHNKAGSFSTGSELLPLFWFFNSALLAYSTLMSFGMPPCPWFSTSWVNLTKYVPRVQDQSLLSLGCLSNRDSSPFHSSSSKTPSVFTVWTRCLVIIDRLWFSVFALN